MAFEEVTRYVAYCSGSSDLGGGCQTNEGPFESKWGYTDFEDDMDLVRELQAAGWFIELMLSGYPRRYAEVMCLTCRKEAGE